MTKVQTNPEAARGCREDHESARDERRHAFRTRRNLACLAGVSALLLAGVRLAPADEVTDWNHIMLEATLTPPATPAPITTRSTAIVQAAVFDAVNGIDPQFTPVFVRRAGPRRASKRAAAVQAAYAILIRLYPAQSDMLDQERSTSLWAISRGWDAERSEAIETGVEWGQSVADDIWNWRATDGFSDAPPPFLGGTVEGEWRPTPPAFVPGLVPQLARVTPWAIESPSQFRPPPPPALDSVEYATNFNETRLMGSSTSSSRTTDQTAFAYFWQTANPADYWDPVAISFAKDRELNLVETARLLAQMHLAMADAMVGCWDAKYTFAAWRPITAIVLADPATNPETAPDSTWTPLLVTPPFPEYPSAHSCASGAAVGVLSHYFGEHAPITVTNDTVPGQVRNFSNLSAALEEVIDARVFGGLHFRSACVAGQALGNAVAEYVLDHSLRRLDRCKQCDRPDRAREH